jgi:hypothetical protein
MDIREDGTSIIILKIREICDVKDVFLNAQYCLEWQSSMLLRSD